MVLREVRAGYDDHTVTVYQAYSDDIADAALAAGKFVPPFRQGRMTWIKPSFRWMAYRCGYASKPGQERVLAVSISRPGFEWALGHAVLSTPESHVYPDHATWRKAMADSPVRVQWDPERSLRFEPLDHRSLQLGLAGDASQRYVEQWTIAIGDVTPLMREVGELVAAGDLETAGALIPAERPYPVPPELTDRLGMTHTASPAW